MGYILVSCARSNTSFNLFLSDYFYVVKNTLKCPIVLCLGLLSCSHYSVTINGNISAFSVHTYQEPFVKVLAQLTPFRNKIAKICIKIGWKIKKLKFWPLSVISETFRDGGNPSKYGRTLSVPKKNPYAFQISKILKFWFLLDIKSVTHEDDHFAKDFPLLCQNGNSYIMLAYFWNGFS